jgi:hypothetical protein
MADQKQPEPIKEHGVPEQSLEEEPLGMPTSDRHHTEITPAKHDKQTSTNQE